MNDDDFDRRVREVISESGMNLSKAQVDALVQRWKALPAQDQMATLDELQGAIKSAGFADIVFAPDTWSERARRRQAELAGIKKR